MIHSFDHSLNKGLSLQEKQSLCKLARETLQHHFSDKMAVEENDVLQHAPLLKKNPVFVTLWKQGYLRGCCGFMDSQITIVDAVKHLVLSSAFQDSRFPPLEEEELDEVVIEISVLTDPVPMKLVDDIMLGRHGLWVKHKGRSGVYLPQVAPECGWDKETFLCEVCLKAGLPGNTWKKGAEVLLFESVKFSEGLIL
ncbi:MAG: AmmeMemoRadiSam system protein A [Chlamydiota bacterium]|nr:AmmeMemoRadiSam system protein A [Chlamydiota bacterium]